MSLIIKTKAFVLNKMDFGDTSKIAQFYTEDLGRISGIIKGARSPKSKIGKTIDVMNYVDLVFYKKEGRDLQIVSQADLIAYYPRIKTDLERLKYASSIMELLLRLTMENDQHKRLFRGVEKILQRMEKETTEPILLFTMFFKFFLEEIGYGLETDKCSECQKPLLNSGRISYNHEIGLMCESCSKDHLVLFEFSVELFNKMVCLSQRNAQCSYTENELKEIITFFERFLIYHVDEFQGIKSLKIY